MKTLLSRSVSMVLALCMIVTMFACAFTVASADSTRLDNWQGNITAVVEADYTAASGSYMKWSETDLYVGDSVKTNGGWFNGNFTYENASGESTTGQIDENANWYCDGTWKFNSQLYYGKINGSSNNDAKAFDAAGSWTCTVKMKDGTVITLAAFEVKELPRLFGDNIFTGNIDVKIQPVKGQDVVLSTNDLYVGDTLKNGTSGWWSDYPIAFEYEGVAYTGKVTQLIITDPSNNKSTIATWSSNCYNINYTFAAAGSYTVSAKLESVTDTEGNSHANIEPFELFKVKVNAVPRMYQDLSGNISYDGAIDVKVIPISDTGITLSTDELYVGDKLKNGTSRWWTDFTVPFEYDGVAYTGKVTWLTITDPNGKAASGYHVYNGGAIDYVCKTAGEYTLSGKLEQVKDTDGNSHSNIEPVEILKFTVKACPHNYLLTNTVEPTCTAKGYSVYTCSYCADEKKTDYVDAKGHELSYQNGVVTCADCDYTKEYTGAAEVISYKSADRTGITAYTTMPAVAFVGDTIKKEGDGWWNSSLPFTVYDDDGNAYTGSSWHAWIMLGNTEKKYFQPGNGQNGEFTFDEEGVYTLVGQIETGSSAIGNVKIVLATIQVFNPVQYNVTVIGRNGNETVTSVSAGTEIALADLAPFTYGYKVASWAYADGTAIDTDTITVTEDITLVPTFAVDSDKMYNLTVSGAVEDVSGQYNYNDKVTVKFDNSNLGEGKYFGGWQNGDGNVISYKSEYTFFVGADLSLTPVIVDNAVESTPVVNITDVCDVNGDGTRFSIMMERSVPKDGYTYISSGFIYSANSFTDPTEEGLRKSVSTYTARNAQYRLTINLKVANEVNVLAYCTYLDADGVEHTIYSNNGVAVRCAKNA